MIGRQRVKVAGIMEIYINNYIFMTSGYFNDTFGYTPDNNRVLGILDDDSDNVQAVIGERYLSNSAVKSLTFLKVNMSRFENMIQSLDLVTWVLIISAGMLAFVVLYNLTNVNISERIREIATIKVLGFYDNEVESIYTGEYHTYTYRRSCRTFIRKSTSYIHNDNNRIRRSNVWNKN